MNKITRKLRQNSWKLFLGIFLLSMIMGGMKASGVAKGMTSQLIRELKGNIEGHQKSIKHKSSHDEFMKNRVLQQVDRAEDGQMEWRKFRPHFDWELVDKEVEAKWPSVKDKVVHMKKVFETVHNYFHDRMEVLSEETMDVSGINDCYGYAIPQMAKTGPVSNDMVIQIVPYNEATGWFAAAGACAIDSRQKRPIMGVILLNFYHIRPSTANEYYVPLIFIHEFMHVMGFSSTFFDMLGLAKTIPINGTNRYALTSPKVVAHAKKYFGCDKVQGIPLENGGGSGSKGSHFEKQIFPNEVMNPMVAYPATISEFTIKVFEDMGFYRGVKAHQRYTYLKGDGCRTIVGQECTGESDGEYCRSEDYGHSHCYTNKLGKARCESNYFTDKCGFKSPTHSGLCTLPVANNAKYYAFEDFGPHSRCAMVKNMDHDKPNAACLRMKCTKTNVVIKIEQGEFTCPPEGGRININTTNNWTGYLDCPKFEEICEEVLDHRCSMDCSGKGYCMGDRTCQCLGGFTGRDCNDGGQKETDPFVTDYEYDPTGSNPDTPDSPDTPENPENPENPDSPDSPDTPDTPDSPEVANLKKEILTALKDLMTLKKEKYQLEMWKKRMQQYFQSHSNKNWYSKREIRMVDKKMRKEINPGVGKVEVKISDLNDQVEKLMTADGFDKWENEYNDKRDHENAVNMQGLLAWVEGEMPQVKEKRDLFARMVQDASKDLDSEPDKWFKKLMQRTVARLTQMSATYEATVKLLDAAAEELRQQIPASFAPAQPADNKKYAVDMPNMEEMKKFMEEEKNWQIQSGFIEEDHATKAPVAKAAAPKAAAPVPAAAQPAKNNDKNRLLSGLI